jgi:predicted DNA-binding transcriptional regulator YafY
VIIDPHVFETVFTALKTHQTISIEYRNIDNSNYIKQTLDPYHAIAQRTYWYIIAHSHENPERPRIYSFSRMRNVNLTGNYFTVPEGFNPHDYFDKQLGVFTSNRKLYTFEFLIHKDIQTYALERHFHDTQTIKQNDDGSVYVSFSSNQIEEVLRWVLGQGYTVKVLNPPELIEMVKTELNKMLGIYS